MEDRGKIRTYNFRNPPVVRTLPDEFRSTVRQRDFGRTFWFAIAVAWTVFVLVTGIFLSTVFSSTNPTEVSNEVRRSSF